MNAWKQKLKFKIMNLFNGHLFAIFSVLIVLAIRWACNPILGSSATLLSFIFPVIVVSLFFGMKPGILATVLGALASDFFFVEPEFSFSITRQSDVLRILIFLFEGLLISILGEFHLRKKHKLEEALARQRQADERARKLENDLAKVWRLNTLGEMASGLAHELAQPISSIKNYSVALQKLLDANNTLNHDFVIESIKGIGSESDRATKYINSLRTFIGGRKPHKQIEDINLIISELDLLIKSEASQNNIKIKYVFSEPVLKVKIDKIQIMQVILNLLRNAIESMNSDQPGKKEIIVQSIRDNGGALISVNDNGCGIPAADEQKVFDAFFSTKESGMGIGLAISRSMIEIHEGKIWNQPNEDRGTTFNVWLPLEENYA